jgi:uncharacterized protein (TIGR02301 family)
MPRTARLDSGAMAGRAGERTVANRPNRQTGTDARSWGKKLKGNSGTTRTPLSSRLLGAMSAAAIFFLLPVHPAGAQFEWLFGQPQPPPAAARPAAPGGGPIKPKPKPRKPKPAESKAAPAANAQAPAAEEPPPPFDAELLKLSEIMGALAYLDELCATNPSGEWREKMKALLDAEAKTNARKEKLAGSYNRGFRDYERSYQVCTPNAQTVIVRFLAEGGKIAHEVVTRYGGS